MKKIGTSILQVGRMFSKSIKLNLLSSPTKSPLIWQQRLYFSENQSPQSTVKAIPQPPQGLCIQSEVKTNNDTFKSFQTKGSWSIIDQLKGTKQTDTGELYALMFTCGKCNTKSLRSFTKNAYHKGVVLIRCEGCQNVHLVADNLGWFGENVQNIQNIGQERVKRVDDQAAVAKFLKAALQKPKDMEMDKKKGEQ